MKKLLLSSIIMFGVCSFATAQSAKSSNKLGKATPTATEVAPATSFTTANDVAPVVKQDKTATPQSDQAISEKSATIAPNTTATKATVVNADGTVGEMPEAKQIEMKKAAAAKAAATKKSDN